MAESRALAYKEKLDQLLDQARKLSPEAEKEILRLLAEMNREVLADIAAVDPKSYNAARLRMLKAEIERVSADFARAASTRVNALQMKGYIEAAEKVDAVVAAGAGGVMIHPIIDHKALSIAQGYTADLITGLSQQASAQINSAIQRAYMGGMNLSELIDQVGRALGGGEFGGLFSAIGDRATTIATNEVMRVHSLASQARMQDLATRHSDLRKEWLHLPIARKPRLGHLVANGQVREVDKPFDVDGEALMYPRDPSGSAENTINCHCIQRPVLSAGSLRPTDAERELLKQHGISVEIEKNVA